MDLIGNVMASAKSTTTTTATAYNATSKTSTTTTAITSKTQYALSSILTNVLFSNTIDRHQFLTKYFSQGLLEPVMYKNRLQEYTQKLGLSLPEYETRNEGFQDPPKFRSCVIVNGKSYVSGGAFPKRKEAEQDAAKVALEDINETRNDGGCPSIQAQTKLSESYKYPGSLTNQESDVHYILHWIDPRTIQCQCCSENGKYYQFMCIIRRK